MRINTKLTISFLFVGFLSVLAATYLSTTFIEKNLNEASKKNLVDATVLFHKLENTFFSRTSLVANLLAEDKDIQNGVEIGDNEAVLSAVQQLGKKLVANDQKVNDIEYLSPSKIILYSKSSTDLHKSQNPIWTGYSITTTQNGISGLMMTSLSKIEKDGKILGGFKVGIWSKDYVVDQISPHIRTVNATLLTLDFKTPPGDEESAKLYKNVYEFGIPFTSPRLVILNKPNQASCIPLKGLHDKVLGSILLTTPTSLVAEVWNPNKKDIYVLMLSISAVLAILLGYTVAFGISRPIRKLVRGVEEIKKGNLNSRIKIKSGGEIKELSDAINNMTEELQQMREMETQMYSQDKLASLGQLTAGIAHEIRNPLGSIKSYAGILKDKFLNEGKEREISQIIIDQVDRLNTFITDFLNYARTQEPKIVPTPVERLLDSTIKLVQTQYPKNKYPIEFSIRNESCLLGVDPQQIQQVFLNLMINAWQAMPRGGMLRISYGPDKEKKLFRISFKDQGKGIPEEDMKKIFKPFFTTRSDGTGLGLWVVHQIIERHNGLIEVKSEVGKGTEFSVFLPMANLKGNE